MNLAPAQEQPRTCERAIINCEHDALRAGGGGGRGGVAHAVLFSLLVLGGAGRGCEALMGLWRRNKLQRFAILAGSLALFTKAPGGPLVTHRGRDAPPADCRACVTAVVSGIRPGHGRTINQWKGPAQRAGSRRTWGQRGLAGGGAGGGGQRGQKSMGSQQVGRHEVTR